MDIYNIAGCYCMVFHYEWIWNKQVFDKKHGQYNINMCKWKIVELYLQSEKFQRTRWESNQ